MQLKLSYFDIKGRAEPIRLALTIGGVAFEDHRFKREEWQTLKPTLPFHQVPVLAVDGKVVAQSLGLLRYAGILSHLYPTDDPFKGLLIDQVIYQIADIKDALGPTLRETDEAKKLAARQKIASDIWPNQFAGLESVIATHGSKHFAVGDSLTIADVLVYIVVGELRTGKYDGIPVAFIEEYKRLIAIYEQVSKHPKVADWESTHK